MYTNTKSILVIFILALLSSNQAFGAAPIPSEIKSVVAFVFIPNEKTNDPTPYGTAFFVAMKDTKKTERAFGYLVTAKHVLKDTNHDWLPMILLRLNLKTGGSEMNIVPLVISGPQKNVYIHPDPSVDVAVIPMFPDQDKYDIKFLPENMITTEKDYKDLKITEGSEVFFTGLFSPYVGTKKNYPVVRFGRVSLVTDDKIRFVDSEAQLYLIETGSYGGNSGSPVFFFLGSDSTPGVLKLGPPIVKLAGIMSGSFLDLKPITPVETSVIPAAPSNMGIAAVVPAYKLYELLLGEELIKQRNTQ